MCQNWYIHSDTRRPISPTTYRQFMNCLINNRANTLYGASTRIAPTFLFLCEAQNLLLGFAQTHFIFLSWYKKTKQKKIKAERTEPTRWVCSFAERRKLAFGSDSSTFFFAHFRTSGFASRHVMPFVLCSAQTIIQRLHASIFSFLCFAQTTIKRFNS